jgi:hypothetical protein
LRIGQPVQQRDRLGGGVGRSPAERWNPQDAAQEGFHRIGLRMLRVSAQQHSELGALTRNCMPVG